MTSRAFLTEPPRRRQSPVGLSPLAAATFAAAADPRLAALLEAYAAAARAHAPGLPPAEAFRPERLLALGMTARAAPLAAEAARQPSEVAAALRRAAAGPRLHRRPARYRLTTAAGARLLALLPLAASGEQGEVVQVLAAFGL